jgi:6-phosphogluconolactonase
MKRLLFIGTYSVRDSKGLYACEADAATGALTLLEEPVLTEPAINPTFLACRGNWLYAVSELGDSDAPRPGALTGFHLQGHTGALKRGPSIPCGRGSPCHVLVFDEGRRLAVSQYKTGELYIIALAPDGAPDRLESVFRTESHGPVTGRQDAPHVHSAFESPDGSFLYSADLGGDRIYRYRVRREEVVPLEPLVCPPGSGPRHMTMSADGRFLWAVGELDSTLIGFAREGDHYLQFGHWPLLPPDFRGESWAAEIRLHPNGRWLYATNRGLDDVTVMAIQPDGSPAVIGRSRTGAWPRGMILSPDGRFLYTACQNGDSIDTFAIDPESGLLEKRETLSGIPSPVGFAFAG